METDWSVRYTRCFPLSKTAALQGDRPMNNLSVTGHTGPSNVRPGRGLSCRGKDGEEENALPGESARR